MQTIQINEGQTLLDIAIQYCGDADKANDIALLNGLDIDDIVLGQSLKVPDLLIGQKHITQSLQKDGIIPASAIEASDYEDEWTLYYTTGLPASHE